MPLPLAHALVGATVATAVIPPRDHAHIWRTPMIGGLLAVAPDIDVALRGLGITGLHRTFTHSLASAVCVGLLLAWYLGRDRWREALGFGLAFASHGLLDFATTVRGSGVALLWPLLFDRYRLGVISLSEFPGAAGVAGVLYAVALEIAVFLPPLLVVLWLRMRRVVSQGAT